MSSAPTLGAPARRTPAVRLDGQGLRLGESGERLALLSGSLHYWQLDRELWQPVLREIKSLGFACVDTYIPWSVHERAPGAFSFDGRLDVEAFLELCWSEGLHVIARPGPHINAELTEFGYPERLIADERFHVRTATGASALHVIPPKAFPIVGYCVEEFYDEVAVWFDAVCPILARQQYPAGPVVLVQADNEHSYFFKLTPYDVDYGDGAVAHYRSVLREKYGTPEALGAAYGTAASFEEVEPPRRFEAEWAADLPRYLDWALAKERYLTDGVRRIAAMLRERGVDQVPISHNSPGWFGVPYDHVALEDAIDVHGIDYYVHRGEYEYLKQGCLYLTGTARLPFIPEFGAGTWPWWEPIGDEDAEANTLAALMHGVKAINYYMLVERDRWLGSPIGRRGDLREGKAQLYRRLLSFLEECEWTTVERDVDVLLLYVREYERLAFVSRAVSPPFFPDVLAPLSELGRYELFVDRALGLDEPIPRDLRDRFRRLGRALSAGHYAYALGDSESPLETLRRAAALVVPSYAFMAESTQRKLCDYAEAGGRLIAGPRLPHLDEAGRPCTVLRRADPERVHLLEDPDAVGEILRAAGLRPATTLDNPHLDLATHRGGGRTYHFVANPTGQPQRARLAAPGLRELRDAWRVDRVLRGEGAVDLELAPHEIQVWSC